MKIASLLGVSLLLASVAPALAQTPIAAGETVRGALTSSSARDKGRFSDCYVLETQPNENYRVLIDGQMDTSLAIGRGFDCQSVDRWDLTTADISPRFIFGHGSELSFSAGGGAYLISARSRNEGSSAERGNYFISVQRRDGASGPILQPGVEILSTNGTASTASGTLPQEKTGQTLKDCDSCPEMVVIRPGSFMMGSPATEEGRGASEGPRHLVTIARAFAMGKYEVTFDEYDACVADKGCRQVADNGWGRGRRPVVNVSFLDALRYASWLSKTTGQAYYLPSESEWEYAARAGTDTPWNTGSAIVADDANILDQFKKTVAVGGYPANAWGLHDTHGNVAEWVQDCMDTGYVGVPTNGGAALSGDCKERRVVRDGSFSEAPAGVRSAHRRAGPSRTANTARGFRVARAL